MSDHLDMSGVYEPVWELRERRTWRLLLSSTDVARVQSEYERRLRRATRFLNRAGLHGGIPAERFVDLVIVKCEG